MILRITHHSQIKTVQKKFHEAFPFLKLEFFDIPHGWGEPVTQGYQYDPSFRVSALEKEGVTVQIIRIHPWSKTGMIEKEFEENFGLHVQVYRRSGYKWVQTAGTDELSLEEQNELGMRSVANYRDNLWIEREALL